MKTYQWAILSGWAYLMGMLFMGTSSMWKGFCDFGKVDMMNIFSCVKGEILSPFVYIFFSLGIVIMFLAWFETD